MTGRVYREYELYCNAITRHPVYTSAFFRAPADVQYTITLAGLRKLAAKAGWTCVRSDLGRKFDRDYCPEHKPAETGKVTA